MVVALVGLPVMRDAPSQVPSRDSRTRHSLETTVKGTIAAALLIPLLVLVILSPITAAAALGFALATWPLVKGFRQLYQDRKQQECTSTVCSPDTNICA